MSGWSTASHGWGRVRRERVHSRDAGGVGRWTVPDVAILLVAFAVRWELGVAFLALKLWHQVSGSPVGTLAFAREKWDALVDMARGMTRGGSLPFSLHVGARSSGNVAFDTWRQQELGRIEAERRKLAAAERDFARYRDELLHVKDREDFERFQRARATDAG